MEVWEKTSRYVQLPFSHGILDLQPSVFNQSSNASFWLKEEKTELHEDDVEVGTNTEKVKEVITTIDNGYHFCHGIFVYSYHYLNTAFIFKGREDRVTWGWRWDWNRYRKGKG